MNSSNCIEGLGFPPFFWKRYSKINMDLFSKAAWDFQPLISYI